MSGWEQDKEVETKLTEQELFMIDLEAVSQIVLKTLYGVYDYDEQRLHFYLQKLMHMTMSEYAIRNWEMDFKKLQVMEKPQNGCV